MGRGPDDLRGAHNADSDPHLAHGDGRRAPQRAPVRLKIEKKLNFQLWKASGLIGNGLQITGKKSKRCGSQETDNRFFTRYAPETEG